MLWETELTALGLETRQVGLNVGQILPVRMSDQVQESALWTSSFRFESGLGRLNSGLGLVCAASIEHDICVFANVGSIVCCICLGHDAVVYDAALG